ncbi:hypothetical protein BD560DRAFT_487669 [Blakeslea trispora]|nr:hypothetical protein BD560DRAFT_487669 [Blakeslea trispora]
MFFRKRLQKNDTPEWHAKNMDSKMLCLKSLLLSSAATTMLMYSKCFNLYNQKEGQFAFEDYDVGKAMSKFAYEFMAYFQQHCNSMSRFRDDMNRWLAIHGVLKLNKCIDTDLAGVFYAEKMERLYRHFRIEVFGKPAQSPNIRLNFRMSFVLKMS